MVWLAVNTTAISGTKYFGMSSEGRVKINSPPSHIHPSLQTKANFLCPINHSPSPQDGVIPMILNLATVKSFLLNPKELLFKYQHTKKKKKKQKLKTHTHTHTHTEKQVLLTIMPCLRMSLIMSSSRAMRKFSLGWSMRGTTSSRMRAT